MPSNATSSRSLLADTETLVERFRACLDVQDNGAAIQAWLDEVHQLRTHRHTARSDRLLPRMPWEIEHDFYYPRYLVARELERYGMPDEALDIYDLIISVFEPYGTAYYERPAILLERMERYDEAIAICDRAIAVIEAKLFHADAEPFRKRKARLLAKKERRESPFSE